MKPTYIYILAAMLFLFASEASAQEFKTDESISKQIINGSVPGWKYAAPKAKKATPPKDPTAGKETIRTQLKNQSLPGMKFATGETATAKKTTTHPTGDPAKLSSNSPAPVVKKQEITVVPVPTQEDVRVPENNTAPAKATDTKTVSKKAAVSNN